MSLDHRSNLDQINILDHKNNYNKISQQLENIFEVKAMSKIYYNQFSKEMPTSNRKPLELSSEGISIVKSASAPSFVQLPGNRHKPSDLAALFSELKKITDDIHNLFDKQREFFDETRQCHIKEWLNTKNKDLEVIIEAIRNYTRDGHEEINQRLREAATALEKRGYKEYDINELLDYFKEGDDVNETVYNLLQGLTYAKLKEDFVVKKGIQLERVRCLLSGCNFESDKGRKRINQGYVLMKEPAMFSSSGADSGISNSRAVQFYVMAHKGNHALFIAPHWGKKYGDEKEVLFQANTKFRVIAVYAKGDEGFIKENDNVEYQIYLETLQDKESNESNGDTVWDVKPDESTDESTDEEQNEGYWEV